MEPVDPLRIHNHLDKKQESLLLVGHLLPEFQYVLGKPDKTDRKSRWDSQKL